MFLIIIINNIIINEFVKCHKLFETLIIKKF